ncbi:MAG: DUF2142 domain-containing protein [Acidobacteria bacterium]|nr:DUF2142 domain-containing protein [Acidobacteriota bacterium]
MPQSSRLKSGPNVGGCAKFSWTRLRPETIFLSLVATFGLAVLAVNPPFQAPDEHHHFFRAFQLSEGQVLGQRQGNSAGGPLPVAVVAIAADTGEMAFHYERKMTRAIFSKKLSPAFVDWSTVPRMWGHFPGMVVRPPTGYLPQAVAIGVGKLARVGPLGLLYLARLCAFVVCAWLGWVALRRLPVYRWSCMLLLLVPMSLYLMGSVAEDGLLIGSAFLLAAMVGQLTIGARQRPTWGDRMLLLALALLLATVKIVYLPLACLALVLTLARLRGRDRVIFGLGFLMVCVLPAWAWWARAVPDLYVPTRSDIPLDPMAQLTHVLGDPLGFLSLVVQSIRVNASDIYRWFVGTLGWGDTPMPEWFYHVFGWSFLACVAVESTGAGALRWRERAIVLGAVVAAVVLIFGAQYANWNAPGSRGTIDGVQGRYFLPVAPFAVLSVPAPGRLRVPDFCAPLLGSLLGTISAIVCLAAVLMRYYLP